MKAWLSGAAVAIALTLGSAASAAAQPPEGAALGAELAHQMFSAMNFTEIMRGKLASMASFDELAKYRPEWKPLMADSIAEELTADAPAIERIVGRRLAEQLTLDELRAGVVMLNDPAARQLFASAAAGGGRPTAPPAFGPDFRRAAQSTAGQSLMRKLGDFNAIMNQQVQADIVAEVAPGALRRFGERAEAAERARQGQVVK